jgi:hypothetical protein
MIVAILKIGKKLIWYIVMELDIKEVENYQLFIKIQNYILEDIITQFKHYKVYSKKLKYSHKQLMLLLEVSQLAVWLSFFG